MLQDVQISELAWDDFALWYLREHGGDDSVENTEGKWAWLISLKIRLLPHLRSQVP
jgi:hypothetical protein